MEFKRTSGKQEGGCVGREMTAYVKGQQNALNGGGGGGKNIADH